MSSWQVRLMFDTYSFISTYYSFEKQKVKKKESLQII